MWMQPNIKENNNFGVNETLFITELKCSIVAILIGSLVLMLSSTGIWNEVG